MIEFWRKAILEFATGGSIVLIQNQRMRWELVFESRRCRKSFGDNGLATVIVSRRWKTLMIKHDYWWCFGASAKYQVGIKTVVYNLRKSTKKAGDTSTSQGKTHSSAYISRRRSSLKSEFESTTEQSRTWKFTKFDSGMKFTAEACLMMCCTFSHISWASWDYSLTGVDYATAYVIVCVKEMLRTHLLLPWLLLTTRASHHAWAVPCF